MLDSAPPGTPYHRLARTARHRWWRPVVGSLLVATLALVAVCLLFGVATVVAELTDRPLDADELPTFGPVPDVGLLIASVALVLPAVFLAAWLVQRRPAGTLSSVLGRVRWRWLASCLLVAGPVIAVMLLGSDLLLRATGADDALIGPASAWVGWPEFLGALLVILLLVPFQAAAEEYVFRGWLMQAVGAWLRSPWPGLVLQAVLFAAAHGLGTTWGFADLVVMGLLCGWLVVRTGGLEAAVALHVVNNVMAFGVAAAYGGLASDETMTDAPWQVVAVDLVVLVAYTAIVARLADRRGLATVVPTRETGPAHDAPAPASPAPEGRPEHGEPVPGGDTQPARLAGGPDHGGPADGAERSAGPVGVS